MSYIDAHVFDLEDSLHYAVADELGAILFYSNDTDFDNMYIER